MFGLIPAQYKLYKTNKMISTNIELKLDCEVASSNYDYWWEAPECKRYTEYHKEYEQWLINN